MPVNPLRERVRAKREQLERTLDEKQREMLANLLEWSEAAALMDAHLGLQEPAPRAKVNSEMLSHSHRAALSKSQSRIKSKPKSRRFLDWIGDEANGTWSLNRLAKALERSPASISQAQLAKSDANSRPIRRAIAQEIERLTNWPADDTHWPGGIID